MFRAALVMLLALNLCCAGHSPPPAALRPESIPPMGRADATVQALETPRFPASRVEATGETLHGQRVEDPFRWLEDEKSPEVQAWMKAQDDFTRAALARLPGREALRQRYAELYYLDSVSAPIQRGGRYFYFRTHKDREKAILYWKEGPDGAEKVLLDPNLWTKDNTVSLGVWVPSWDGKRVVFAQKPNAADEAVLHVVEVATGHWSNVDVIAGAKYAHPSWTPDGKAFYYEWLPSDPAIPIAERPGYTELRLHRLGTRPETDTQVHPRTGDPKTFLSGSVSRDGKNLFVFIARGWNENDVYLRRLGVDSKFKLLAKGNNARFDAFSWKGRLYFHSDEGAPNGRLFAAPVDHPERAHWTELVPEDPGATLEGASIVGGRLALSYLRGAVSELRLALLDGKPLRQIELPGVGTSSGLSGLEDVDEAFFEFSSFVLPRQTYRTSIATGKTELWAKVEVPIDPSAYLVEQVRYPSKDGTAVSMFIVHRKDLKKDGTHPTLLYGYGGFNVSLTSSFTSFIYPWLEAGGVYAVPNLRGGGEYGKAWHDAGKGHQKGKVFEDFIAAAEYLVAEGYTRPSRLAIRGGSNGGLLTGAAMTQRPDLFGAVLCAVPLLDMVRYDRFGSGATWVPEYGSPANAADFQVLYGYSPYHQLKAGVRYPPLLMLSSDHDDRVDPMHARKFVARVQQLSASGAPSWLRIEANAGHGGADQVAKTIDASADQVAFLFSQLGVSPPAAAPRTPGG